MRSKFSLIIPLAALILVGAGCGPSTATPAADQAGNANPSAMSGSEGSASGSAGMEAEVEAGAEVGTSSEPTELMAPAADEREGEWSTYTNQALDFSFDWPSTGKYAPRWEVTFLEAAEVTGSCYQDGTNRQESVSVGGQVFCHTWTESEGEATVATDYYVTVIGEQPVMITFNKSAGGIHEFSWEEYRDHLDQIISGFQL